MNENKYFKLQFDFSVMESFGRVYVYTCQECGALVRNGSAKEKHRDWHLELDRKINSLSTKIAETNTRLYHAEL